MSNEIETQQRWNVLLVEDNLVNQQITINQLKIMNCDVQLAKNGLEAIKATQEQNFDLIIMDCHMPKMDGYDATRKIREMEIQQQKSPVPIIALTADVMILNRENCLSVGMNDFLGKPVVLNDLKKILDIWLINPASS